MNQLFSFIILFEKPKVVLAIIARVKQGEHISINFENSEIVRMNTDNQYYLPTPIHKNGLTTTYSRSYLYTDAHNTH